MRGVFVCGWLLSVFVNAAVASAQELQFSNSQGDCSAVLSSEYVNRQLIKPGFPQTSLANNVALLEALRAHSPEVFRKAEADGLANIAKLRLNNGEALNKAIDELGASSSLAPASKYGRDQAAAVWAKVEQEHPAALGSALNQEPSQDLLKEALNSDDFPLRLMKLDEPITLDHQSIDVPCDEIGIYPAEDLPELGTDPKWDMPGTLNDYVQSVPPPSDIGRIPSKPPVGGTATPPTSPEDVDKSPVDKAGYQSTSLISKYDEFAPGKVSWPELAAETEKYLETCQKPLDLISKMAQWYDASASDYRSRLDAELNSSSNDSGFQHWQQVVLKFFADCRISLLNPPTTALPSWQQSALTSLKKTFVAVWRVDNDNGSKVLLGCSGYLVGDRSSVLTARHCVATKGTSGWDKDLLPCSPAGCSRLFVSPFSDDKNYDVAAVDDLMVRAPAGSQAGDLVILRLKSPVATDAAAPGQLNVDTLAQGTRLVLAGIPADLLHAKWERETKSFGRAPPIEWVLKNWKSAVIVDQSPACHIVTPPGKRSCLTVSCASLPGMSGGPVLRSGTDRLIGAMSGAPGAKEGIGCAQPEELTQPRSNVVAVPTKQDAIALLGQ